MKLIYVIAISTLAVILVSCGGTNSANRDGGGGDALFALQDNWQITMSSMSGTKGSAGGVFQENFHDGTVSGVLGNINPPCASNGALSGSIQQNTVNFSLNESGLVIVYSGTIGEGAKSMSGTYTAPAGNCTIGDSGTWTANRIPAVTGTWKGTLTPSSGTQAPFQVMLPLTQDSTGKVIGTSAITGSSCLNAVSLATASPIAGQQLILAGQFDTSSALQLTTTLDLAGTTMNVDYSITGGSCDGQVGSGTLKKQ